jgi:hypothetical protein
VTGVLESLADRFGGNFSRLRHGQLLAARWARGDCDRRCRLKGLAGWGSRSRGAAEQTGRAQVLRSLMQHTEQRAS